MTLRVNDLMYLALTQFLTHCMMITFHHLFNSQKVKKKQLREIKLHLRKINNSKSV